MAEPEKDAVLATVFGVTAARELSPDSKFYYVNTLHAGVTAFDLGLTFGRLVQRTETMAVAQDQCEIRMSPQFFKLVVAQMQKMIGAYEAQFGAVSVADKPPEEIKAAFEKALRAPNP